MHPPTGASGLGALAIALLLGAISFAALGIAMSTMIPNQQAAGPLTSTVFFVLLFLSGLWFPIKSGSTLGHISAWFPIRHFITAVYNAFNNPGQAPWAWHHRHLRALEAVAAAGGAGITATLDPVAVDALTAGPAAGERASGRRRLAARGVVPIPLKPLGGTS